MTAASGIALSVLENIAPFTLNELLVSDLFPSCEA